MTIAGNAISNYHLNHIIFGFYRYVSDNTVDLFSLTDCDFILQISLSTTETGKMSCSFSFIVRLQLA